MAYIVRYTIDNYRHWYP